MKEIKSIKDVFIKYIRYYKKLENEIEQELKKCPRKGSVIKKKIGYKFYYYLNWREGEKQRWKYLGKLNPIKLRKSIKKRRRLLKQLRIVKDNLYTLNLSRRQDRMNNRLRFQIFERDNFTCQYCGRNVKKHKAVLVVDHIIPKKKGGSDDMSNLITACIICNSGKHKQILKRDIEEG